MTKEEPTLKRRILILGICCMSILMVGMDVSIVNVALPSLQRDLHASISGAQWTIDAYTLVLASLLLLSGATADRIGRRRTFQTGLVIFSLGSLLCSLAPSITWLVIFRMLQAIGGSMLNPVALSIINNTFTSSKERARAVGAWAGVIGISTAAGPVIGGILVDTIGWRSIFWLNIPIGILALILTALYVPESKVEKHRRIDPVGQFLVIAFLASLVYGIIKAPSRGWGSGLTLSYFAASIIFLVSLIRYEKKRFQPLIELRFFKSAPFAGATMIATCTFIGLGGFLFLNTLYLQDVKDYSAIKAGLYLLPMASAMLIAGPLSGYIVGKRGPRIPLISGGLCTTAAAIMFAISGSDIATAKLFLGYALIGFGLGLINAAITNTALSGMPRSQAGVAAATASTSRQVGQSLGVAIIGSVLAAQTSIIHAGHNFNNDSRICWYILSIAGFAVLITAVTTTGKWALHTAEKLRKDIEAEDHELALQTAATNN
jgi:EmrB/QacA subfamily drug resistance transporter